MMSDNLYGETSETSAMRSWALWQMLRGMGWAALAVFGLGMTLLAIWGVSLLLPEASKQAPSPYSLQLDVTAPRMQTA